MDFRVSQVEDNLAIFHEKNQQKQKTCDEKIAKEFCVQKILSEDTCER
jgi:hypothetical protein